MSTGDRSTDPETGTSDRLPHKPTRESATAAPDRENVSRQRDEPAGQQRPPVGAARREVPDGSTARHPPHVTENDENAPVQDATTAPDDVAVLPANASGRDSVGVDEQDQPIDPESMYDRRPSEHKGNQT